MIYGELVWPGTVDIPEEPMVVEADVYAFTQRAVNAARAVAALQPLTPRWPIFQLEIRPLYPTG